MKTNFRKYFDKKLNEEKDFDINKLKNIEDLDDFKYEFIKIYNDSAADMWLKIKKWKELQKEINNGNIKEIQITNGTSDDNEKDIEKLNKIKKELDNKGFQVFAEENNFGSEEIIWVKQINYN